MAVGALPDSSESKDDADSPDEAHGAVSRFSVLRNVAHSSNRARDRTRLVIVAAGTAGGLAEEACIVGNQFSSATSSLHIGGGLRSSSPRADFEKPVAIWCSLFALASLPKLVAGELLLGRTDRTACRH